MILYRRYIPSIRRGTSAYQKLSGGEVRLAIQKIKRHGGAIGVAAIPQRAARPVTSAAKCSGCRNKKDDENLIKLWIGRLRTLRAGTRG